MYQKQVTKLFQIWRDAWNSYPSYRYANSKPTMNQLLHRVFVYGTLKRGEPNHNWFSKDFTGYYRFIGEAKTVDKYPLIIGTKYNVPFLLYSPGDGAYVKGELYEVDDKVFASLDDLEDHPKFYEREERDVLLLDSDKKVKSWIYFIKNFKKDLLKQPTYESYSSNGPHGLKYVPSDNSTLEELNLQKHHIK